MIDRFEERLKSAIRILEEEKEVIHSQAMKKLEEDMQALIQRAEAEREEYLQLYTKVYKKMDNGTSRISAIDTIISCCSSIIINSIIN